MTESKIDMERLRPLELRVRTPAQIPDGGVSEHQARRHGRVAADAFVLMRVLFEETQFHAHVTSLEGTNLEPLGVSALYHLWVAFTGHLASQPIPEGDEQAAQQIAFANKVLALLDLDNQMERLSRIVGGASTSDPAAPSDPQAPSTPAETSSPPDEVVGVTG